VTIGALLPVSPFAHLLGFGHLSPLFYFALVLMVIAYLTLTELIKQRFFRPRRHSHPLAARPPDRDRRIQRRAFRWSLNKALSSHPPFRNVGKLGS
jgi:Mg2+-importing ATPase